MGRSPINPYATGGESEAVEQRRRWLPRAAFCLCLYQAVSAVSLPFANTLWIGSVPIFAPIQLPKSFLKSVIHDALLYVVHAIGWSKGSPSPDYGMTHPLAMIGMLVVPALLAASVIFLSESGRRRTTLLSILITCTVMDAIVTLWFETSFSLKFYNARYL